MCPIGRTDKEVSISDPVTACGGYEAELPSIDYFKYRYYFTGPLDVSSTNALSGFSNPSSYFPFTPACLRGCCWRNKGWCTQNGVPGCSSTNADGEIGYNATWDPRGNQHVGVTSQYTTSTGNTKDCAARTPCPANSNGDNVRSGCSEFVEGMYLFAQDRLWR